MNDFEEMVEKCEKYEKALREIWDCLMDFENHWSIEEDIRFICAEALEGEDESNF